MLYTPLPAVQAAQAIVAVEQQSLNTNIELTLAQENVLTTGVVLEMLGYGGLFPGSDFNDTAIRQYQQVGGRGRRD